MPADFSDIDIVERRAWSVAPVIVFIGPGGAGKSTVSRLLAPLLGRTLTDLDLEFCERIDPIDAYIRTAGYEAYKQANSQLARELVSGLSVASRIIVKRQLARGLGLNAHDERQKIEARFDLYKSAGDMLVISAAPPEQIAASIAERLSR